MTEWVLAGCTKTKREGIHPAKDLYKSPLFKKRKALAKVRGDGWGILSAKYGYIRPWEPTPYYQKHISERSAIWGAFVLDDLLHDLKSFDVDRVTILAGRDYVDPLVAELEGRGYDVLDLNRGLRPGERMSKLNGMMNHTLEEVA